MRGQKCQKGVSRDEAVTRSAKDTDTDVGMEVRSTMREHGEKGRSEERVMGSRKDRRTSAHSVNNDDTRKGPMEGMHGAERVGTPKCSGCGGGQTNGARNPAYN